MSRTLQDIPNARITDPESSHVAGEENTASGERESQMQRVLTAVRNGPGRTSLEMARINYLDRYVVARRLADLEHLGLVHKGDMRPCLCAKNNRAAVTWWPGPAPKPPVETEQGQLL